MTTQKTIFAKSFQPTNAIDQSLTSSKLMKPNFKRLKRKHKLKIRLHSYCGRAWLFLWKRLIF